jgi:hypothetical protein
MIAYNRFHEMLKIEDLLRLTVQSPPNLIGITRTGILTLLVSIQIYITFGNILGI